MGLLLDAGTGGTLRGLRDQESDVGAVHIPETVATEDTETPPAPAARPAGTEQTPEEHAARLLLRRRLSGRLMRPPRGFTPPR